MKKCWIAAALALLLAGCGAQETFETVSDVYEVKDLPPAMQVQVMLPDDAAVPAMEDSRTGQIYLCDGYFVTVQILEAGDLNRTLQESTGFSKENLPIIETARDGLKRYECVWTSAGEAGDQVGRAVVLDDGSYHYVVTVMADAVRAGALQSDLQNVIDSVKLTDTD